MEIEVVPVPEEIYYKNVKEKKKSNHNKKKSFLAGTISLTDAPLDPHPLQLFKTPW